VINLREKILEFWNLDTPTAATMDEWDEWKENSKASKPLVYFLRKTLPDFIKYKIIFPYFYWPIRDPKWALMYRFHPNHKYNIIKPRTLKPSYYDPLVLILHANMEILVEFVEHERSVQHVDWHGSSKEHGKAWDEMNEICDWWTIKWPEREKMFPDGSPLLERPNIPEEWGHMASLKDKYKDEPIMKEYIKYLKNMSECEEKWEEKEQEMLMRLIKIRKYMWN